MSITPASATISAFDADLFELVQGMDDGFDLGLFYKRIERDVEFYAVRMGKGQQVRERSGGEIFRPQPGVEIGKTRVHRVGAGIDRRMKTFDGARGREEFGFHGRRPVTPVQRFPR